MANTYMCVAVVCEGEGHTQNTAKDAITCQNADVATVYTGIVKEDNLAVGDRIIGPGDGKNRGETLESLANRCWRYVDAAVAAGYEVTKQAHIDSFQNRMKRVQFPSTPPDPYLMSSMRTNDNSKALYNRLDDYQAMAAMYQFGRYLMLSAASKAASNLQVY